MKATIYGAGYVGLVTAVCFAELGHDVCCMDIDAAKIDQLNAGQSPIYEENIEILLKKNIHAGRLHFTTDFQQAVDYAEIQMIAVGTPPKKDGSADLQYVDAVAKKISEQASGYRCIVNKSTVPVGTAARMQKTTALDVDSNPEFLREGQAIQDCLAPNRIVIGVNSEKATERMQALYAPLTDKGYPLLMMDTASAELTKYAANAFLATKVSFMNEMSQIAERTRANIHAIKKGIGMDPRIGNQFLDAGCGFGGSCFPKDVSALKNIAEQMNYTPHILNAVLKTNTEQQQFLFHQLSRYFQHQLKNKTIALWGLAFKPNTDDVRSASSCVLMELLWKAGAFVRAYDPLAMRNIARLYPNHAQLTLCETAKDALKNADVLTIVTEWNEFKNIDLAGLKKTLQTPAIFDGRNMLDAKMVRAAGFEYFGIGA